MSIYSSGLYSSSQQSDFIEIDLNKRDTALKNLFSEDSPSTAVIWLPEFLPDTSDNKIASCTTPRNFTNSPVDTLNFNNFNDYNQKLIQKLTQTELPRSIPSVNYRQFFNETDTERQERIKKESEDNQNSPKTTEEDAPRKNAPRKYQNFPNVPTRNPFQATKKLESIPEERVLSPKQLRNLFAENQNSPRDDYDSLMNYIID